jgi:predicted ATP-grasp superfamily ATP-dependent carboligase
MHAEESALRLVIYEHACAVSKNPLQLPQISHELPDSVVREGRAMLEALVKDARQLDPRVQVVVASELTELPAASQGDYALVIAPEFDSILQACVERMLALGYALLGPLPSAISLTADKWKLYQHWHQRGVPTPTTSIGKPESPTGRYLTKHRYGAGSLGIQPWQSGMALQADHLVQQELSGEALSIALLLTRNGTMRPLPAARQFISTDGHYSYQGGELLNDPSLQKAMEKLAYAAVADIPGLQGYVGIDMVLSDDILYAIEINPRLTTSYLGLRQVVSPNLLELMLIAVKCDRAVKMTFDAKPVRWGTY